MPTVFYSDNGQRRIVFQVWDWINEDHPSLYA